LVVGGHEISALQKRLNIIQNEIDREINSVNIDEREFKRRIKNKDPFLMEILKGKKIKIVG
jgi:hypothetical protein